MKRSQTYSIVRDVQASPFASCPSSCPTDKPGPLARSLRVDARSASTCGCCQAGASSAPWDVRQPAMSWARMLDMPQTTGSETTISRNWSWLEEQRLVRTERDHRVRKVTLLMEDGSGREFDRATGKDRGFFKLPYAYFTDRIHRDLKLAGKATLLICLPSSPRSRSPPSAPPSGTGVRGHTPARPRGAARAGPDQGLDPHQEGAPHPVGYTTVAHYALRAPFARPPIDAEASIATLLASAESATRLRARPGPRAVTR